ncbi:hypothetical protein [Pseudomonas sp. TWP3-1]|uniref:hypothetical protein n=1 Tax=Pseudomonas sp. TWP3-1 TaxID=2804631 RepID=UPI003CF2BAD4
MSMNKAAYPRLKVFLIFLFCPAVPGFIAGIVKTFATIAHIAMNPRLIGEVAGAQLMLMPFLAPVLAVLIFLIPFLFFSAVIALTKVMKTPRACMLIALSGASLATLWVMPFILAVVREHDGAAVSDYAWEIVVLFLTSMATCWLTARLSLPETQTPRTDQGALV